MARKNGAGTLDEQRESIRRRGRGRARVKEVRAGVTLEDFERTLKQQMLCYLKAAGFSNTYCKDALGVARSTIQEWLDDESLHLRDKISKISADMISAGVTMMQTYLVEIIEGLMQIFRETEDEKIAKEIGFEILDRLGISKVNKSEAVSANLIRKKSEVDITDKTGLVAMAKNAPPHVQAAMAERAAELVALAEEHAEVGGDEPS